MIEARSFHALELTASLLGLVATLLVVLIFALMPRSRGQPSEIVFFVAAVDALLVSPAPCVRPDLIELRNDRSMWRGCEQASGPHAQCLRRTGHRGSRAWKGSRSYGREGLLGFWMQNRSLAMF